MKISKITFIATFFPLAMFANTPPVKVGEAFSQRFPNVKNVHWGKENKSEWEGEFNENGIKKSAVFSIDGQWLETETKIPTNELPDVIAQKIKESYKGMELVGVDRIETYKSEVFYEAELKSGIRIKEVVFNLDGSIQK